MNTCRGYIFKAIQEILLEHESTHALIPIIHPHDSTCLLLYEEYETIEKKIVLRLNDIVQLTIGHKACSVQVASNPDKKYTFPIEEIPITSILNFVIQRIKGVMPIENKEEKILL